MSLLINVKVGYLSHAQLTVLPRFFGSLKHLPGLQIHHAISFFIILILTGAHLSVHIPGSAKDSSNAHFCSKNRSSASEHKKISQSYLKTQQGSKS